MPDRSQRLGVARRSRDRLELAVFVSPLRTNFLLSDSTAIEQFHTALAPFFQPMPSTPPGSPRSSPKTADAAHFIFGFGSLINADSRRRTGESGAAHPCYVKNLRRFWSHKVALPVAARPNPAVRGVSAVSVAAVAAGDADGEYASKQFGVNGVVVSVDPT